MTAGELRALGVQAGIGPGVTVLDLCCGVAGPGRLLTRDLGCDYLGVDASASAVAAAVGPGGRFAFTLEEGPPLTTAERAAMPDADTVWLTPLDEMISSLERAGLAVTWQ